MGANGISAALPLDMLRSAQTMEGLHSEAQILVWLAERISSNKYSVESIPLNKMSRWVLDSETGNILHESGNFFRAIGLNIEIGSPIVMKWQQPIILQQEVGILGFIAKNINGVLHVLAQAKMEPGNINLVQISPTVQATRSNYLQAHGGKRPAFVDYFIEPGHGVLLLDQLHSEQGGRYYRKRNRNVIIQVDDTEEIDEGVDFRWVTLGQLNRLHRIPNTVHLDCRSILGGLIFDLKLDASIELQIASGSEVMGSLLCSEKNSNFSMAEILSWLAGIKVNKKLDTQLIELNKVQNWACDGNVVRHESGRYFQIIGVDVQASNREVSSWSQPLIKNVEGGVLGLLMQRKNGVLHFLIQARLEPGFIDAIELAPTIQYSPTNYVGVTEYDSPAFVEYLKSLDPEKIYFDGMLSDEGGRFYRSEQRHIIAELEGDLRITLPPEYIWMTLAQIQTCARFSCMVNIELRSLLSCLSFL